MTANELYRDFLMVLEQIYERSEAASINNLLFENVAGISKSAIIKNPAQLLDEKTHALLTAGLERLKKQEPLQYVTGLAWFYNMTLKVSPAVLIPRPETEELVDAAIKFLQDKPAASILDIGTGSGCIAIAIKKNLPAVLVTAIDISQDAITIATENSSAQQTNINFTQQDFLDEKSWHTLPMYDVIISNPPYIPENEKQLLDKNVTEHEPHLALFVTDNRPLIFYEKIAAFGKTHLTAPGKIFLETHEHFANETAALFDEKYYTVDIREDLNEKQRMVIVSRRYP